MQYMLPLLNMHHQQQKLITKVSISILVMSLPLLYVSFLHIPPATLFRDTTFWFLMSNSIIIVIAADSGMLFFGSSSTAAYDDRPFVVSGDPAVFKNQALVVRNHGDVMSIDNHALDVKADQEEQVVTSAKPESREMMLISSSSASTATEVGPGEAVAIKNVDGALAQARARLTASKSLVKEERTRRRRSRSHSHALVTVPVQDKSVVVRGGEAPAYCNGEAAAAPAAAAAEAEESEYARLSDEELNRRVEEFITTFNREIRLQMEKEQA